MIINKHIIKIKTNQKCIIVKYIRTWTFAGNFKQNIGTCIYTKLL